MNMFLTKNETQSMRGVAIVFIVMHNLLHWLLPTIENEFTFSYDRTQLFWKEITNAQFDLWQDIFSFLGWYGVSVFLFLSGYGLSKKYSTLKYDYTFTIKDFIWRHFKSLFFLMILPYIPFAMMQIYYNAEYLYVFTQLTLVSNILNPFYINPGVFWFFGLIFQFYILFALLLICERNNKRNLLLILNVISIIFMFFLLDNPRLLNWSRHNFIGWLLPFSMGIFFAQDKNFIRCFNKVWQNVLWVVIGGALIILSNFNYYTWIISSAFSILSAIGLTKLISKIRVIDNVSIWLGSISAYLFAIHPAIRFLCTKLCWSNMNSTIYILGYLLVSIIIAVIYKRIHKNIFSRWLV